jgi:hypothetical protein
MFCTHKHVLTTFLQCHNQHKHLAVHVLVLRTLCLDLDSVLLNIYVIVPLTVECIYWYVYRMLNNVTQIINNFSSRVLAMYYFHFARL